MGSILQRQSKIGLLLIFLLLFFPLNLYAQNWSELLKEGIKEYRAENYEEAAEILKKVRKLNPRSSVAAFFLGLSYKQMLKYEEAISNFKDAITLTPKIKEALIELIDCLYRIGRLEEAKKYLRIAEENNIYPAKTLFLKGLILQKENRDKEAIKCFEKAKKLNPDLEAACNFRIGISYVKLRRLKEAKREFEAVVTKAPNTDLAEFARRYMDLVKRRLALERPLRITALYLFQYDDNVVLRPNNEQVATGITGEQSIAHTANIRIDFIPHLPGNWLFSAYYSFYGNFHRRNSTTHDISAHTVSISPGYSLGRSAINILGQYTYVFRHEHRYMDTITVGPLFRTLVKRNNMLEFFAGFTKKRYLETPLLYTEDRDSIGTDIYLSWISFFKKNGFFNLRYEFTYDDTEGENWENHGNRVTLNLTIPLIKRVSLQLGSDAYFQDFENRHTVFKKHRVDHTYTILAGFTINILKNVNLILQYTRTRCDSNIAIYDYTRNVLSSGVEIRF